MICVSPEKIWNLSLLTIIQNSERATLENTFTLFEKKTNSKSGKQLAIIRNHSMA